jgi:hypothetical protein
MDDVLAPSEPIRDVKGMRPTSARRAEAFAIGCQIGVGGAESDSIGVFTAMPKHEIVNYSQHNGMVEPSG